MEESNWSLHPQLRQDCHLLGRWPNCHLLLNKNAALHWFLLVPETASPDLLDLPPDQQNQLLARASQISRLLKHSLGYPKVNFAAIGNVVPQLHLHVVGRRVSDACWPAPVWGNLPVAGEYSTSQIRKLTALLAEHSPEFHPAGPDAFRNQE